MSSPRSMLDEIEQQALKDAGQTAGRFLEAAGALELQKMEKDTWRTFLQIVFLSFSNRVYQLFTGDPEAQRMRALDSFELSALYEAGAKAGQMLVDEFRKTDLRTLTREEWFVFLATIVNHERENIAKLLDDQIPF